MKAVHEKADAGPGATEETLKADSDAVKSILQQALRRTEYLFLAFRPRKRSSKLPDDSASQVSGRSFRTDVTGVPKRP